MDVTLDWDGPTPHDAEEAMADFVDALPGHLEDAGDDIGMRVAATAAREVNVDTGRLRASIDHEVRSAMGDVVEVVVGSNVDYAPFQEMDHPYLRPAFHREADYIEERILEAVRDAWEEAMS